MNNFHYNITPVIPERSGRGALMLTDISPIIFKSRVIGASLLPSTGFKLRLRDWYSKISDG